MGWEVDDMQRPVSNSRQGHFGLRGTSLSHYARAIFVFNNSYFFSLVQNNLVFCQWFYFMTSALVDWELQCQWIWNMDMWILILVHNRCDLFSYLICDVFLCFFISSGYTHSKCRNIFDLVYCPIILNKIELCHM